MLLPTLSHLPVLEPYHLLMLNYHGQLHFSARFLLSRLMDPEESSWQGKSTAGMDRQRMAEGNLFLGGKERGSNCKACQEQGRKCPGQAAVSPL